MLIVIDNFLTSLELEQYCARLELADWQDGTHSAGGLAAQVKANRQLADNDPVALDLANRLLQKLGQHPVFVSAAIPHKIHQPRFNRYSRGEAYGVHVDAPIMSLPHSNDVLRSDVSATLFLAEPNEYEGGELLIEGQFGAQEVKLAAGDIVVYPSSSLHQVLPVTAGTRQVAILWAQSMIADAQDRSLLFDLDQSIQSLTNSGQVDTAELMRLTAVYHNLVRRWAVV